MAEQAAMNLPPEGLNKGAADRLRIVGAPMSGAAISHPTPEAAPGGSRVIMRRGDRIEPGVPRRRLHLDLAPEKIVGRLAAERDPVAAPVGGHAQLCHDRLTGAGFDFLSGCRGSAVGKDVQ
jgi:L-arabonate dehydrase